MSMTKAERARVEELETALAMHWPAYPEPRPLTREQIEDRSEPIERRDRSAYKNDESAARGWFVNAYGNGQVSFGWKNDHLMNRNSLLADGASRSEEPMYGTKQEALMALRIQKSRDFASVLASIDASIRDCNP